MGQYDEEKEGICVHHKQPRGEDVERRVHERWTHKPVRTSTVWQPACS